MSRNFINGVVMVLTLGLTLVLWYLANRVAAGEFVIELEAPPPAAAGLDVPIYGAE